jgi:hypothetical protein
MRQGAAARSARVALEPLRKRLSHNCNALYGRMGHVEVQHACRAGGWCWWCQAAMAPGP